MDTKSEYQKQQLQLIQETLIKLKGDHKLEEEPIPKTTGELTTLRALVDKEYCKGWQDCLQALREKIGPFEELI